MKRPLSFLALGFALAALAPPPGRANPPPAAESPAKPPATQPAATQPAGDILRLIADESTRPAQVLAALGKRRGLVKSIQADFVQTKKLRVFNHTVTQRGRIAIEPPQRLIWHLDQPVRYTMLLDGDVMRQWDQDTNRVSTDNLDDQPALKPLLSQFRAWLLGDFDAVAKLYAAAILERQPLRLRFTPLAGTAAANMIKQVEVTFSADLLYIQSLVIHEGGDDVTTLRFGRARINAPVPPQTWEIPPHGK